MSNRKRKTAAAAATTFVGLDHLEGEAVHILTEDDAEKLPPLQRVELIRERIMRGQMHELVRLRSFISMAGENQAAVDALHGTSGDDILSLVTHILLRALGADIETEPDERFSKTKRAAAKRMRA